MDLDGTLAQYNGWKPDGGVGDPILPMVQRVRQWIQEGKDVRIMTARVCPNDLTGADGAASQVKIIQAWCLVHLGKVLPVTATKDYQMIELWDDRAVQVFPNTGQPIARYLAPDAPFICGQGGPIDRSGCPELLLVCPTPGLAGFAAYKKHTDYSEPGY